MFYTDSNNDTVLETTFATIPSTSPIKRSSKTKSKQNRSHTAHSTLHTVFPIDKAGNEIVPIPEGTFDTDPFSVIIIVPSVTNIPHHNPIKVKPSANLTQTLVSNTYECLTNDNNDDNDAVENVDRAVETDKVSQTGTTVKGRNNNNKTSLARDESGIRRDADTRTVVVKTREL